MDFYWVCLDMIEVLTLPDADFLDVKELELTLSWGHHGLRIDIDGDMLRNMSWVDGVAIASLGVRPCLKPVGNGHLSLRIEPLPFKVWCTGNGSLRSKAN